MHVLREDDLGRLALRRLRPWDRIMARCLAPRLDRELARGACPEANAALAARAVRLTSQRFRRDLAASLGRLLAETGYPPAEARALSFAAHPLPGGPGVLPAAVLPVAARPPAGVARQPHVPICRARISRSAPELAALAGVLVQPNPVPARGMAMVCLLLSDGGGPLYQLACRDDLAVLVERATQALVS
jgi:hypothetical protein